MASHLDPQQRTITNRRSTPNIVRPLLMIVAGVAILSIVAIFFPDEIPEGSRGLLLTATSAILFAGFAGSIPFLVRLPRTIRRYHLRFWAIALVLLSCIGYDGLLIGYALTHYPSPFATGLGAAAVSGLFLGILIVSLDRPKQAKGAT